MNKIRIPKAAENMEAATIGEWHKQEGDSVEVGEPLVELVTDKAQFDYEAEVSGTLLRIVARSKSMVPVGYIIALIGEAAEPLPDVAEIDAENAALAAQMRGVIAPRSGGTAKAAGASGRRIPARPAARRLARQHDIDLADVAAAAGKKGPLTEDDVRRFIESRL